MFYADDLVILAETFEGLMTKITLWKNGLESKRLKVNIGKTKFMISSRDLNKYDLVNTIAQYARKVSERTGSLVVDVCFVFAKSVPIFQVD